MVEGHGTGTRLTTVCGRSSTRAAPTATHRPARNGGLASLNLGVPPPFCAGPFFSYGSIQRAYRASRKHLDDRCRFLGENSRARSAPRAIMVRERRHSPLPRAGWGEGAPAWADLGGPIVLRRRALPRGPLRLRVSGPRKSGPKLSCKRIYAARAGAEGGGCAAWRPFVPGAGCRHAGALEVLGAAGGSGRRLGDGWRKGRS